MPASRFAQDSPRRWILISREQGIPETPDAGDMWAVDHLLIDQDAVPTLVEVKRGSNSQLRREVVGQMLDYAAHATTTWHVNQIRQSFEESRDNSDEALAELLDSDGEIDAGGFWENVRVNLAAKRVRLLFVADEIPDTLERVVLFLNEQMPNIGVLAVEIKRYSGESRTQMLVPRVIGRVVSTPKRSSSSSRTTLTRRSFWSCCPTRRCVGPQSACWRRLVSRMRFWLGEQRASVSGDSVPCTSIP